MKAQLPKTTKTPNAYLNSNSWGMQQKIDGWRMLVSTGPHGTVTYNRKGEYLEAPQTVLDFFADFTTKWTFDGELLGDTYWIFDLLKIPTGDIRSWPLARRYELLTMLEDKLTGPVQLVPLITENKEQVMEDLRSRGAEGVVFKLLSAEYSGKETSACLKYKFVKQVDCVILDRGVGDKDNFVLGMFDGAKYVDVGKCSALTGDGPEADIGSVIQVDILYVTKGDRLYQPVKPKLRFDKTPQECTVDQLEEYRTTKEVLM